MSDQNGSSEYYGEVLDSIPFSMTVDLMKRMLPSPLAYGIAGYFRLKYWIGLPSKPRYAFGPVSASQATEKEQMPARAMSRWAGKIERLRDLGFHECAFAVPDLIGAKESAGALLLDDQGSTFAVLEYHRMQGANGVEEQTVLEFNSYLANGSEFMTAMVAEEHLVLADAFPIDFVDQDFLADSVSIRKGYEHHLERMRQFQPMTFRSEEASVEQRKHNQKRFDALLAMGVIRKLSPREIDHVRQQKLPIEG
ncbi:MAG: hypothetical protein ACR2NZ_08240 [Rubripirellula sp.]